MENEKYLFGMHPVIEAARAGRKLDKVLVKRGLEGSQYRELLSVLEENGIMWQYVPVEKLNRMVRGAHQGVVACISQTDFTTLEEIVEKALSGGKAPLLAILDGVTDVRNFGAVARSLECAGGSGIIVSETGGAPVNAEAVKASAGALMRLDVCRTNLKVAAYYLKQSGFRIVAVTEKTDRLIYDTDFTGPCALVLGSESKGISRFMLSESDDAAAIPMSGEITSLNVSAAAAVAFYEAVRQRMK